MAHAVQKVVQRCEDCEENGGSMGKKFVKSENTKYSSLISYWNLKLSTKDIVIYMTPKITHL